MPPCNFQPSPEIPGAYRGTRTCDICEASRACWAHNLWSPCCGVGALLFDGRDPGPCPATRCTLSSPGTGRRGARSRSTPTRRSSQRARAAAHLPERRMHLPTQISPRAHPSIECPSVTWLPDRRCSGQGCISTAHTGNPDPEEGCTATDTPPRVGRQTRCGPENRPPPSGGQPTRTASEQPPADRPAAASRPTDAKSTQIADVVQAYEAGPYQYSPPAIKRSRKSAKSISADAKSVGESPS